MKVDQIRALGKEALLRKLEESHEELFNLRFRLATRQLINYHEISSVKRIIARMETILKERELGLK